MPEKNSIIRSEDYQRMIRKQNISEEKILREIIAGNEAYISEFFLKYKDMIYCQAYRILSDREDALDIVHDTIIRFLKTLKFNSGEINNPGALLRTIALNLSLDVIRTRNRHRLLQRLQVIPFLRTSSSKRPWKKIANDELHESLMKMIIKLAPAEQKVICLRHFEHMKLNEIAEVCNSSAGAVKKNLHNAYQKLRKMSEKKSIEIFLNNDTEMEYENVRYAGYELE